MTTTPIDELDPLGVYAGQLAEIPHLRRWKPDGPQPGGYDDLAMLAAVLDPLASIVGPIVDPHRDTARAAMALNRRWRLRALGLHAAGWPATAGDDLDALRRGELDGFGRDPSGRRVASGLAAALNCRPTHFATDVHSVRCSFATICPQCWAYRANETWRAVDARLFPAPEAPTAWPVGGRRPKVAKAAVDDPPPRPTQLEGLALVSVRAPMYVDRPPGPHPDPVLDKLIARRVDREAPAAARGNLRSRAADQRTLAAAGCVGGIESLVVEPADGGWLATIRQLLVVRASKVEAVLDAARRAMPRALYADVEAEATPEGATRGEVAALVGRALVYPAYLMRSRAPLVLEILAARAGRQLMCTFGACRGVGLPPLPTILPFASGRTSCRA